MAVDSSFPSSYSFHGSNSSHSKDNRSGGRTYHIPNYATNYTNERSNLIAVSFDEGKVLSKVIVAVILLLVLVAAVPLAMVTSRFWQLPKSPLDRPSSAWSGIMEADQTTGVTTSPVIANSGALAITAAHTIQSKDPIGDSNRPEGATGKTKWEGVTPDIHCHSFGKRRYTAYLHNLSVFSSWSKTCRNTAITIHQQYLAEPMSCESSWPFGAVQGRWLISVDDSECRPRWGQFHDGGCVKGASRRRAFSASLKGLTKGEDAMALCTSAPAEIQGKTFERPSFCEEKGLWLWASIEGVWEVEDYKCL